MLALVACQAEESDLERHAKRCASTCDAAQNECSDDPDFADPWPLACEVACNFDYQDEARPFAACMADASSCGDKAECVDGGGFGSGTDTTPATTANDTEPEDDDDDAESSTSDTPETTAGSSSGAEESGSESGGVIEGHACCDVSGAPCSDAAVLECVCPYMSSCCTGAWGEVCASVAVANGCLEEGCGTLEGWTSWTCTCSTYDVYCTDNPFVSQLIFGTDACGTTQADALAIVEAACEGGDAECTVGAGSCECECTDDGTTCGPS